MPNNDPPKTEQIQFPAHITRGAVCHPVHVDREMIMYLVHVECSPKPDPCVMRVSRAPQGRKETLDEAEAREASHAGADHPKAS